MTTTTHDPALDTFPPTGETALGDPPAVDKTPTSGEMWAIVQSAGAVLAPFIVRRSGAGVRLTHGRCQNRLLWHAGDVALSQLVREAAVHAANCRRSA